MINVTKTYLPNKEKYHAVLKSSRICMRHTHRLQAMPMSITKALKLDIQKHTEQYEKIEIKQLKSSHDRFLLIDDKVYHLGASLKDLGKKWFAFSLMEEDSMMLREKIREVLDEK